jgi:hypothetical protein
VEQSVSQFPPPGSEHSAEGAPDGADPVSRPYDWRIPEARRGTAHPSTAPALVSPPTVETATPNATNVVIALRCGRTIPFLSPDRGPFESCYVEPDLGRLPTLVWAFHRTTDEFSWEPAFHW